MSQDYIVCEKTQLARSSSVISMEYGQGGRGCEGMIIYWKWQAGNWCLKWRQRRRRWLWWSWWEWYRGGGGGWSWWGGGESSMQTFMGASGGGNQFCHLDSYSLLSNSKYCKTGSKGTTQSKSVVNSGVHHRTSWTSPPRIGYVWIYVIFQLQLIPQLVFL